MECVWTEETVRAHIEEQYNKFRSVCRDLYRGLLSEADVHQEFEDVFYNGFSNFQPSSRFILHNPDRSGSFRQALCFCNSDRRGA